MLYIFNIITKNQMVDALNFDILNQKFFFHFIYHNFILLN